MGYSPDNDKLSSLYSFITEAKELDLSMYETPPPRAKFQEGQFVTVRDAGKFKSYHTKRHLPYANKSGEIIGYYNYPGAYTKYTIKFNDGTILPIHSQFILGPFKSKEIARTYEDPNKEIEASDIKFPENRPAFEEWQIKENIESIARQTLTQEPYNFTWHDTPPTVVNEYDTKNIKFVLAERGMFKLTRENNKLSKRLTGGAYGGYQLTLPPNYHENLFSGYAYNNPLCTPFEEMVENTYRDSEIKKIQTPLFKESYRIAFEITEHQILNNKLFIHLLSPYLQQTGDVYVLTVPGETPLCYDTGLMKNCSILDNLIIKGNVKAIAKNVETTFFRSPKEIHGELTVEFSPKNFEHIPKVLGGVTFRYPEDKKRYLAYIASTHHPEYKDILDF
jgi:hypothetical protein